MLEAIRKRKGFGKFRKPSDALWDIFYAVGIPNLH